MTSYQTILKGSKDTFGVVVAFLVLFLSLGAMLHEQNYTFWQTFACSALIAAAPLQVAIIQLHHHYSISLVILLSLAINFRCLLLSSALLPYLRNTSLFKLLLPLQGLASSTFAVVYPEYDRSQMEHPFTYFATVALLNYAAILLGTVIGFWLDNLISSHYFTQILIMILPINFVVLIAKVMPKWGLIIGALLGFIFMPLFNQYLGQYAIIALPLIVAGVMLTVKRRVSQ